MVSDYLPVRRRLPILSGSPQLSWTVWGLFLTVVAGGLLISTRQGVYPIFSHAGSCWLQGEVLYDASGDRDQFLYPPIFAAFFVPFSLLPDSIAGVLWRFAGLGFFAFALTRFAQILAKDAHPPDDRHGLAADVAVTRGQHS